MSDNPTVTKEDVKAVFDKVFEQRVTPDFLAEVSKPGNLPWLELLFNRAMDRVEKKTRTQSGIVG